MLQGGPEFPADPEIHALRLRLDALVRLHVLRLLDAPDAPDAPDDPEVREILACLAALAVH